MKNLLFLSVLTPVMYAAFDTYLVGTVGGTHARTNLKEDRFSENDGDMASFNSWVLGGAFGVLHQENDTFLEVGYQFYGGQDHYTTTTNGQTTYYTNFDDGSDISILVGKYFSTENQPKDMKFRLAIGWMSFDQNYSLDVVTNSTTTYLWDSSDDYYLLQGALLFPVENQDFDIEARITFASEAKSNSPVDSLVYGTLSMIWPL